MKSQDRYDSLLRYYASQYQLDWLLLKAQDMAESAMHPMAVSPVGARGLAQFMQNTWEEWRDGIPGVQEMPPQSLAYLQPENPEACIHAQAAYMAWLIKHCGEVRKALAAYNFGIGRVLRGDPWPKETRDYVARIEANLARLRENV